MLHVHNAVSVPLLQKRYSLQAGPPKKDPKSKAVNPAAVQALLKKQLSDTKKKGNNDKIKFT